MSAITSAARATNIRARMPADTNPSGDIFGGWIMSLMDVAGAITATRRAEGRVVTASVSNIEFLQPVKVGDCPLLGSADQAQRLMTANCQSRKSPLTPLRGTPGERWRF
jgi:acyl-coenzyme A thioesterase PaaI-like protein